MSGRNAISLTFLMYLAPAALDNVTIQSVERLTFHELGFQHFVHGRDFDGTATASELLDAELSSMLAEQLKMCLCVIMQNHEPFRSLAST